MNKRPFLLFFPLIVGGALAASASAAVTTSASGRTAGVTSTSAAHSRSSHPVQPAGAAGQTSRSTGNGSGKGGGKNTGQNTSNTTGQNASQTNANGATLSPYIAMGPVTPAAPAAAPKPSNPFPKRTKNQPSPNILTTESVTSDSVR